jgi:hypothetical protein
VVTLDNSAYEGAAIVIDLNAPLPDALKNRFTAVIDGGCLEHIFNFPQAIKNSMEMLSIGGHFLGITPANNFCGHGFYQFSPGALFSHFLRSEWLFGSGDPNQGEGPLVPGRRSREIRRARGAAKQSPRVSLCSGKENRGTRNLL